MESKSNILSKNYFPQQKEYYFEEDNLKFTSKFDSGNMLSAEKRPKDSVVIYKIK
jgi:hypothetical protein